MAAEGMLTPKQAAAIAGVSASTVKRWAEQEGLPSVRTPGGHRRFTRSALEQWLQDRHATAGLHPVEAWIEVLVTGRRHEVDARLLEARARLGSWHALADELGSVLGAMGDAWQDGRLGIGEEHRASEVLARGLARIGDALPAAPEGRPVLLACLGDDDHTLGLSLAELCVREVGLPVVWLGGRTPVADVERFIRTEAPVMVALSASSASNDVAGLAEATQRIGDACREQGAELVLGGTGPWPETPDFGTRQSSFAAFHELLQRTRGA
ncbi:MAG: helix-turn-helix domain-containing protein [Trueperaceae bacterium]|nr:helix-turn-helix domain-containing protein [Trueperaceae bacterium]